MSNQWKVVSPRLIIQMLIFIVPMLPLLISWHWWEAWVFAFIFIFGFAISRALAARRNLGLLAERARLMQHEGVKTWDKTLAPLVGLGGALIPLVVGLDARFGWSTGFALAVELVALGLLLAGYIWSSYALIENRFFSGRCASRLIVTSRSFPVVPTAG